MKFFCSILKYSTFLLIITLLQACGSGDGGKVSKGHRDAIRFECKDSSDVKACGLEVRENFLEAGNDFVTLEDLTKEQVRKVKLECIRSKKFGLEPYNNCLDDYRTAALGGTLFQKGIAKKPKTSIENLELSTVRIDIIELGDDDKIYAIGGGSGVILDSKLIATNCHVVLEVNKGSKKRAIGIKNVGQEKYGLASIYKKSKKHDVCIIKKDKDLEATFDMKSVKKLVKFKNLERGDFVRTFGTPIQLEGHTAKGEINYLGTAKEANITGYGSEEDFYEISPSTKIISHSAQIAPGSSGGPLFDKNGYLIGLNTFMDSSFNYSVSADHIKELLKK